MQFEIPSGPSLAIIDAFTEADKDRGRPSGSGAQSKGMAAEWGIQTLDQLPAQPRGRSPGLPCAGFSQIQHPDVGRNSQCARGEGNTHNFRV